MKQQLKLFSITLVFLFVSGWAILFFLPTPPLLSGISFSTAVYDQQQHLLRLTLSKDDKYRLYTPLNRISQEMISATLLQEDQFFYQHYGINPFSIFKAFWQTYVVKSRRVGASTITMQVARMRYGINSKTWSGKALQIVRALQMEMHYSKPQILEAYFNLAPYGNNIEGVGSASLIYFDKPASKITLPEALTLSIIPQNPTKRTPRNESLQDIRNKLFARWIVEHPEDLNKKNIIELPLVMRRLQNLPFLAPHFVNQVLKERNASQETITTLDVNLQNVLTKVTRNFLARKKTIGAYNAAIMLVDVRDMGVRGLVGSANFFDKSIQGEINGTQIKRSPGSTLKPFIYGLALDQGLIHPSTVLKDVPRSFGAYNPENFDYDFMGPIRARDALVLSRNIPAIYLASQLTHPNLYELLENAQVAPLKPESYYGLSLALGGAEISMRELVGLYAMLANEGIWHPIRMHAEDPMQPGKKLLSAEASFLILDILKDTPRPDAALIKLKGVPVSWKTGTSSGFRDAWTVGTFGPYVLAVWIGNFDNKSNPAFVGKNLAAPLFFELLDAIQQTQGHIPINAPQTATLHLEKIPVCKASGLLPTRYCTDTELTWFIPGKSPIKTDNIYREVAVDKATGLRTCRFAENTRFAIYEFWPSDLLRIFKQAGIQRKSPPPFEPGCSLTSNNGLSPQITSPQSELRYIIPAHATRKTEIPLTAVTDADVETIYWFVNDSYLAKTHPDEAFLWAPKAGKYVVRVLDDHGLSDAKDIVIQTDG